jgi:hypothetical protein
MLHIRLYRQDRISVRKPREPDGKKDRRTDIPPQDVLDLLLLETAFDDEAACAVYAACCTHFGEEVLDDVFGLGDLVLILKL